VPASLAVRAPVLAAVVVSRGLVYTLHLWPPIAHAKHYTGWTRNLPQRLADHALGRGGRLPQVQVERGGSWVVAQTEPGSRGKERQLKKHGAARRCEVCKAVDGYQSGQLTAPEALNHAGWDRASQHERGLLLDMFGLSQTPETTPSQPATGQASSAEARDVPAPRPAADVHYQITPDVVALVDQLHATWTAEPRTAAQATAGLAEPEAGS
jgi:hypothetical protein